MVASRLLILLLVVLGNDGFVRVSGFGDTAATDAGIATRVDGADHVFVRNGVSVARIAEWMKEPRDLSALCAWFLNAVVGDGTRLGVPDSWADLTTASTAVVMVSNMSSLDVDGAGSLNTSKCRGSSGRYGDVGGCSSGGCVIFGGVDPEAQDNNTDGMVSIVIGGGCRREQLIARVFATLDCWTPSWMLGLGWIGLFWVYKALKAFFLILCYILGLVIFTLL